LKDEEVGQGMRGGSGLAEEAFEPAVSVLRERAVEFFK
jgi:hypothetical protein